MNIYGNKLVNTSDKTVVYTIETIPLHVSLSNLADVLTMMRINPFDFGGQRLKVKVTMDIHVNKLVNTI